MNDGRTLSPRQAAELLGVSAATVRRYADAGVLRAAKLPSGYRRFELRDVVVLAAKIQTGAASGG
jgi:excisionase family DNA binding protein